MISPVAAIRAAFLFEGLLVANWFQRIPDVRAALGLSTGELGFALAATSVAMVCTLPLAGTLASRLSERASVAFGFVWLVLTFLGIAAAWNLPSLATALFVYGIGIAPIETALNTSADRIEAGAGRKIMASCHGCWSVGTVAGTFTGTTASTWQMPLVWHFLVAGVAVLIIGLATAQCLPDERPDHPPGPIVALPTRGILALCLLPLAGSILEGAMFDWAGIYMRVVHDAGPGLTGMALVAFTVGMAIFRFAGDPLIDRFGPVRIVRVCGGCAVLGLAVIGLAPSPWIALAGFVAMAAGVSVVFPTAVTAAARRGDRPGGVNVASLSLLAFTGFVAGPPLVGGLTQHLGMRGGLLCLMPFAAVVLVLARQVMPRTGTQATTPKATVPIEAH